jgi:hypothetical protein
MDQASTCVLCYKDSTDHDGDGYSSADGDCKDCDVNVNPGAFDVPANGVDEDCSGTVDDAVVSCDSGLAFASNDPVAYAKAMELCQFTTASASGKQKTWGVISAELVQADGVTPCSKSLQRAITDKFGDSVVPTAGSKMSVFSAAERLSQERGRLPQR